MANEAPKREEDNIFFKIARFLENGECSRRGFLEGAAKAGAAGAAAWALGSIWPFGKTAEAKDPEVKPLKQMVEEEIKRLEDQRSRTPFEWSYLADLYCEKHRWEPDEAKRREFRKTAIDYTDQTIKLQPGDPFALAVSGRIEFLRGNYVPGKEEAFTNFNDALKVINASTNINTLKRGKNSDTRLCELERIFGYVNLYFGQSYAKLAEAELNEKEKEKKITQAVDYFVKADNVEANAELIKIYTNEYISAKEAANSSETRRKEGVISRLERASEAMLKKDLKYKNGNYTLYKAKAELSFNYEMGRFWNAKEDFGKAQKCMEFASQLEPNKEVFMQLGIAYEGIGDANMQKRNAPAARVHYSKAKETYEKAKKDFKESGSTDAIFEKKLNERLEIIEKKLTE